MAAINLAYGSATLNITAPKLDFAMKNTTLDLKVQISKKLFIITPYLGLGLSYGWSTVDFGANSTITITPSSGVPTSWKDDIMGFTGLSLENTGLGKSTTYSGLGIRGFGGFSLNIFVLKIDITGLYDILNGYWGAGVGLRVQI
jgi:hypothetical protein